MFLRFDRQSRRLFVDLVVNRRVDRKVRQTRLGSLGSVAWPEPISVTERMKFWAGINQRFLALRARHPGRISEADEVKIRDKIAKRIPWARTEEELRLQIIATIQRDVMAALDRLEAGEDGMREAAKQLLRLARETRLEKRRREKQEG